jgi:hypothetical protein
MVIVMNTPETPAFALAPNFLQAAMHYANNQNATRRSSAYHP